MKRISSIFMTKTRLPTVNIVHVGMKVVLGWEGGKPFGFPQDLMGSVGIIPPTTTPNFILLVRSFCKLYLTCVTRDCLAQGTRCALYSFHARLFRTVYPTPEKLGSIYILLVYMSSWCNQALLYYHAHKPHVIMKNPYTCNSDIKKPHVIIM